MFGYIGGTFFSFVDAYVNGVSAALSVALMGVVAAALTLASKLQPQKSGY